MEGLSVKKEIGIIYIASCVTLTCTMAVMIDLAAAIETNNSSLLPTPTQSLQLQPASSSPLLNTLHQISHQLPTHSHLLLSNRSRAEQYQNKLANGGLYI